MIKVSMKSLFICTVATLSLGGAFKFSNIFKTANQQLRGAAQKSIFEFEVQSIDTGKPVSLSEYRGKKAYLLVNVASQ